MPIETTWLVEGRIINARLSGEVTPDDIRQSAAQVVQMIDSSDAELVHALHDATDVQSLPLRMIELRQAVKAAYNHPNLGWTVAFQVDSAVMRFLGNMTSSIFSIRYKIVDTREDALAWLQEMDATLPELSPATLTDPQPNRP